MKATYSVQIHLEDENQLDENGAPTVHQHAGNFEVTGDDIDDIREKARKLLAEKGLPPVRSMNMHDGKIIVYCGEHPQRTEANVPAGVKPAWKRPPRLVKP